MAKESRTKTIGEILKSIKKEESETIEATLDECLKAICCESVNWKEFKVYEQSITRMEVILRSMASEYIMVIADKVMDVKANCSEVKILIKKEKETSIWTIPRNITEMIIVVSISEKRLEQLQKKISN